MPSHPPSLGAPASIGHPIRVAAERTGLSQDVLRVWERRYRAVEPHRTPGGQRLYSDAQIRRVRLLAAASRPGRGIGLIAALTDHELEELVTQDEAERVEPAEGTETALTQLIDASLARVSGLDGSALDRDLRRALGREGTSAFIETIVPALMRRIGEEWHAGRIGIAHEHVATEVVLAIVAEITRATPEAPGAPTLLVATPAGERHGVGAALAGAAASSDGWTVIQLGVDLPASDIIEAVDARRPDAVAFSVVRSERLDEVAAELIAVRAAIPLTVLVIAGGSGAMLLIDRLQEHGIRVRQTITALRRELSREAALR
ncbi:MAG: cobalamin-dependent protein [Gemmatimonadota bacterium]